MSLKSLFHGKRFILLIIFLIFCLILISCSRRYPIGTTTPASTLIASQTNTRTLTPSPSPTNTLTPQTVSTLVTTRVFSITKTQLVTTIPWLSTEPHLSTPLYWSPESVNLGYYFETPSPADHITPEPGIRVTTTPSSPESCPHTNSIKKPDFQKYIDDMAPWVDIEGGVLEFLNSGGTTEAVTHAFSQNINNFDTRYSLQKDLTGDNVPEYVISFRGYLDIFGCKAGKYVTLLKIQNDMFGNQIYTGPTQDINLDGLPEIILSGTTCNSPCSVFRIFEWNGTNFLSILHDTSYGFEGDYAEIDNGEVRVQDIDGNGIMEVIIEGGIPGQMASLAWGFPFRKETRIYSWDGLFYRRISTEYAPPQYRFQAVQDGDRASLLKEYDKALEFYQQVIFSDTLDWWSEERRQYISKTKYTYFPGIIATPFPDPDEYYNLAAYARFRIMVLHILRGYLPEAQTVYKTLLEKFPEGQTGHAYAEMAKMLWQEYEKSQDIEQACGKAVQYADMHKSDILVYLGNIRDGWDVGKFIDFGSQSLLYGPQDICPFK